MKLTRTMGDFDVDDPGARESDVESKAGAEFANVYVSSYFLVILLLYCTSPHPPWQYPYNQPNGRGIERIVVIIE